MNEHAPHQPFERSPNSWMWMPWSPALIERVNNKGHLACIYIIKPIPNQSMPTVNWVKMVIMELQTQLEMNTNSNQPNPYMNKSKPYLHHHRQEQEQPLYHLQPHTLSESVDCAVNDNGVIRSLYESHKPRHSLTRHNAHSRPETLLCMACGS